jgi:hypothetical protein
MATFTDHEREVLAGFQDAERKRMERAHKNYEFFRGDFSRYSPRTRTGLYRAARYERTSLLMQRIVEALTKHLYARGPARSLPDSDLTSKWLNLQYSREGIDALLQEADRLSCVGDVAAIQVVATGLPDRPVRFLVWPAHQIVVFESEDDPTRAEAVATIDCYDQRRRLRLWDAEVVRTFETNRGDGVTGGTAFYPVGPAEDHGLGLLPFAFIHFHPPNTEFWSGGPGDHLCEANDYLNFFLTEIGDSIRYCAKPIVKAFGVREGWTPPQPSQPGDVWTVPPAYLDATGNGVPPDLAYLQPDLGFVEAAWADAQSYIDHTLECNNCPPAEIRMDQSGAKSGLAIVMEQLPLVIRAQGRQRAYLRYERDLARRSHGPRSPRRRHPDPPLAEPPARRPGRAGGAGRRGPVRLANRTDQSSADRDAEIQPDPGRGGRAPQIDRRRPGGGGPAGPPADPLSHLDLDPERDPLRCLRLIPLP